jgi:hypothetical protein
MRLDGAWGFIVCCSWYAGSIFSLELTSSGRSLFKFYLLCACAALHHLKISLHPIGATRTDAVRCHGREHAVLVNGVVELRVVGEQDTRLSLGGF